MPLAFGPNVPAAPIGTNGVAGPPHAGPCGTKKLNFHTQTGDYQLVRLCSESVDVMNTLSRWGGDSGGGAYSKSNGAAGVSALRVLGAYIDVVTGAPKVDRPPKRHWCGIASGADLPNGGGANSRAARSLEGISCLTARAAARRHDRISVAMRGTAQCNARSSGSFEGAARRAARCQGRSSGSIGSAARQAAQ